MWQQQQLVSYWSRASTASSARLPSDQAVQTGRGTEWSRPAGQPGGPSRLVAVAFGFRPAAVYASADLPTSPPNSPPATPRRASLESKQSRADAGVALQGQ